MSDEQVLSSGVIISSLGVRYKSYCSNITRTYMIDPSKEKEQAMTILINCHAHIIRRMVPGTTLSQLYNEATQFLAKSDMPTLQSHFYKNMGFLVLFFFLPLALCHIAHALPFSRRALSFVRALMS